MAYTERLLDTFPEQDYLKYYREGISDRKIADLISIDKSKIYAYRKMKGLPPRNMIVVTVQDGFIVCSRCGERKPVDQYSKGRRGTTEEYFYSYCNSCRRRSVKTRINASIESKLKSYLSTKRQQCKHKNITYNLDLEYVLRLWEYQQGKCLYSGVPLVWYKEGNKQSPKVESMSIDRIHPELGYVKGNVCFVSFLCNSVKRNLNLAQVEEWMPKWYESIMKFPFYDEDEALKAVSQYDPQFSRTVLSEDQVRTIRSDNRKSYQELSDEYNVGIPAIYAIKAGITWKHVK